MTNRRIYLILLRKTSRYNLRYAWCYYGVHFKLLSIVLCYRSTVHHTYVMYDIHLQGNVVYTREKSALKYDIILKAISIEVEKKPPL